MDDNEPDILLTGQFGFSNGLILISNGRASSFTFSTEGYNDYIGLPYLYQVDADFKISYDLGGGENNPNNPSKYHTGDSLDILNPPTRPNYDFKGWKEGNKITPDDVGDKTFTAIWEPLPYTVKFDKNSDFASGTMTDQSIPFDTETALTANSFVSNNMKFIGWNTKADGSGTSYTDEQSVVNLVSAAGKTITLYAQWEGNPATITYQIREGDENGGTIPFNSASGKSGETIGTDKVPEAELTDGWVLDGYYIDDKKYSVDELAQLVLNKDISVEIRLMPDKNGNSNADNPAGPKNTVETPDGIDDRQQAIVTFVDEDGTVLNRQVVNIGGAAKAPADPKQDGKTFTSWDRAFNKVEKDLTVVAQYKTDEQKPEPVVSDKPATNDTPKSVEQTPVQQSPVQQVAAAASDLIAETGDNAFVVVAPMILTSLLGIGIIRRFK